MAQGQFRKNVGGKFSVLLGPPGAEIELTEDAFAPVVAPFTETPNRRTARVENIAGEIFEEVQVQYKPRFDLQLRGANHAVRDAIRSIYALGDTQLSFIYADDWKINSERYKLETTTGFYLRTNPYQRLDTAYNSIPSATTIINDFAVWTSRDMKGEQIGTDYFTGGGTYNRGTRWIELASSPGAVGTIVYVNYTFTGCRVRIAAPPRFRTMNAVVSGTRALVIPLRLEAS